MDEHPVPSWLTNNFLMVVVASIHDSKEVYVVQFSCRPAVPAGTNYLSQLYRVKVAYKLGHEERVHSASLIVKTPLDSGMMKEFVDGTNSYGREVQMYRDVLPRMYELHKSRMTARTFECPLDKFLVLEDLQVQGYKMADRLKQLDAEHCNQFLLSLSRFHALSRALYDRDPELIETVGKEMWYSEYAEGRKKWEYFLKFSLSAMNATIQTLPGCDHYAEVIGNKIDTYYELMVKLLNPTGRFNVLNHGDAWTNNVLFKYNDSSEVIDAKLVDLQLCKYCSFAYDVIYFWWTSPNEDVREHRREEMFELYRQSLNQTLEELGCPDRLSKEEFDCEMNALAPLSLSVIAGLLTFVMADPDDLLDFSDFSVDAMANNYRSTYYKALLPNVLRQAEAFGAFN